MEIKKGLSFSKAIQNIKLHIKWFIGSIALFLTIVYFFIWLAENTAISERLAITMSQSLFIGLLFFLWNIICGKYPKNKLTEVFQSNTPHKILYFKDNQSAFDFSCEHLNCKIKPDIVLPAIVIESLFSPTKQVTILKVASKKSDLRIICDYIVAEVGHLKPGDLVAYRFLEKTTIPIQQLSMVGAIVARLLPEYHITEGWSIAPPASHADDLN